MIETANLDMVRMRVVRDTVTLVGGSEEKNHNHELQIRSIFALWTSPSIQIDLTQITISIHTSQQTEIFDGIMELRRRGVAVLVITDVTVFWQSLMSARLGLRDVPCSYSQSSQTPSE